MQVDVFHHLVDNPTTVAFQQEVIRLLHLLIRKDAEIMSQLTDALDKAEAAAKRNSDADDAAEKLLLTLVAMINDLKANGTDPATAARIDALGTALAARADQLGVAIAANTPAAPTPPVQPPPA